MANILMENEIHSMNGEIFWKNMNIRFYCLETECKVKEENLAKRVEGDTSPFFFRSNPVFRYVGISILKIGSRFFKDLRSREVKYHSEIWSKIRLEIHSKEFQGNSFPSENVRGLSLYSRDGLIFIGID